MAKILLVEDDKSLREIYGVRLQAEGYEIVSAGDGEEALAMAIKERPDLIVSDVMMPKISGFDMLDILRSTTETKDVKVIMMTALSSDDQRARGESLGADRYLVKSQVGIEDVVRTVHDVLADGVPSAAPAAPLTPAPAPIAAPVVAPVVTPAPEPVVAAVPVLDTPVAAPAGPAYVAPTPAPAPTYAPEPVAAQPLPQPTAPVVAAPVAAPLTDPVAAPVNPVASSLPTPSPAPAAAPLPQPTAPFSSNGPASLGERVIQPLTDPLANAAQAFDLSSQMDQALASPAQAPESQPPVPPAL